jgi:hypothetical protein
MTNVIEFGPTRMLIESPGEFECDPNNLRTTFVLEQPQDIDDQGVDWQPNVVLVHAVHTFEGQIDGSPERRGTRIGRTVGMFMIRHAFPDLNYAMLLDPISQDAHEAGAAFDRIKEDMDMSGWLHLGWTEIEPRFRIESPELPFGLEGYLERRMMMMLDMLGANTAFRDVAEHGIEYWSNFGFDRHIPIGVAERFHYFDRSCIPVGYLARYEEIGIWEEQSAVMAQVHARAALDQDFDNSEGYARELADGVTP